MASPLTVNSELHKHACSICARRKVKCDKRDPCSNCSKAQSQCSYETPPPPRPRKRAVDDDLLARLSQYEDLMRKHNIDFTHYANIWVPSGLEPRVKESDSPSVNTEELELFQELTKLPNQLKYPPIQSLRQKDDPFFNPTPPLQFILPSSNRGLQELHPEPRHIYRFWQIFVETVNPFTKIIHVPTLQQRILDASWDLANVPNPLAATMFAIYTLAVTSLSSDDCQISFGEARDTLLAQYRAATVQALIAADFLTTKDFEVLQAFVLFLLADPDSDLASTMTAVAVRQGQKMGLHRESTDPKVPFFEKEMRVRLWWQIRGLDSRVRAKMIPGFKIPMSEFGEVRLPLNVNDSDLHPDMTEPPAEHTGPTEMLCVLVKFEVPNWLHSSPIAAKVFDNIAHGPPKGKVSTELEDGAINELEAIYQEKYMRNLDKRIPLHGLSHAMAKLSIARMRFKLHHPRGRDVLSGGQVYMSQAESDVIFNSAVRLLELVDVGVRSKFSSHLFTHLTVKSQMDAYIYVISDLRKRCTGNMVALAWRLIEDLYEEHPELTEGDESTLFTSLAELTLEAWRTRQQEIIRDQGIADSDLTPEFIQRLLNKRQSGFGKEPQALIASDDHVLGTLGLTEGSNFDWDYWNDFLRL
ncbi:hypothetical protein FDECE_7584 [Fusarium decemcellulare]|nr:hypothetical protein FDECE_7584 [Fusarium decemcellulare]